MSRAFRVARASTGVAILLAAGILAGCQESDDAAGTPPQVEPPAAEPAGTAEEAATAVSDSPLAGTYWRLVEIQSMDDAIGVVRPEAPSLYTMRLNRDGTVNMRLNCNRANGTWSSEPGEDGSSGRFVFGPLAVTRALCAPPSLDERIAADSAYVRSYLLKEDRLYLSLMADGGIYVWEPHAD